MPTHETAQRKAAGVALVAPDGRALFVKRSGGDHDGTWCFPGGMAEDGESDEQTAYRELLEETGHDLDRPADLRQIHRSSTDALQYTTFAIGVPDPVPVELCDENSEFKWASPIAPPSPLHPGVAKLLSDVSSDAWQAPKAAPAQDGALLAFDRATVRVENYDAALSFDFKSVRKTDRDGRLHVELSHISKANICPYIGKEIPGWESLGLEPTQIYQLYRDPEELAKAAPTFNNLPLLSEHVPVDARDHRPDLVIGSTGTDAVFNAPYLDNSLVIWAEKSIQGVDSQKKRQLSSAYYYTPDMTPGEANGERYDGVMRDIIGNHVAVVPEGRAGADVTVADSKQGYEPMTRPAKNTRFAAIRAALLASFVPKLAADATIEDLNDLLNNISAVPTDLDDSNDAGKTDPDDANQIVKDADPIEAAKEFLKGKLSDEDLAEFDKLLSAIGAPESAAAADPSAGAPAGDGPGDTEEGDGDKVTPAAMDAAIAAAVKATEKRVAQTQAGIQTALRAVRPYVGDLAMSFDSGEAVLRHSLGMLGVAGAKTIHATALDALLAAQPKPGRVRVADPIAQDAASAAGYSERFPGANRLTAI